MESIGTIAALWRYPVKGLAAEPLAAAEVEADGLRGDRNGALFVQNAGHAREGKPYRGKEQNRLHLCSGVDDAIALGASVRVGLEARAGARYFDDSPVSVILDVWIDEAQALCGRTLEPLRFRPNLFLKTAPPAANLRELDLVGRRLRAGSVELLVTKPIERCVTITYDVASATADPHVLETIASRRENVMGVYCEVVRAGSLATGDTVAAGAPA